MKQCKLLIADLDGLLYHSATDTMENSIQKFNDKFNNMIEATGATHYIGFVGKGKNFRHKIDPLYKSNRTQSPPKYMMALKEWAIAKYKLETCIDCEADDMVAYWGNQDICIDELGQFELRDIFESVQSIMSETSDEKIKYESVEKIIASPDKDILRSIVGKHFNYSYKIKDESRTKPNEELTDDDFNKGWWVETTRDQSENFKRGQLIIGDSADGIKGIPKKGEKYWEKMCAEGRVGYFDIMKEYELFYGFSQGIYEFQKNYRLLHILDCDNDFSREIERCPLLPDVNAIEPTVIEDIKLEINF